jgi:hypothetical protein
MVEIIRYATNTQSVSAELLPLEFPLINLLGIPLEFCGGAGSLWNVGHGLCHRARRVDYDTHSMDFIQHCQAS